MAKVNFRVIRTKPAPNWEIELELVFFLRERASEKDESHVQHAWLQISTWEFIDSCEISFQLNSN